MVWKEEEGSWDEDSETRRKIQWRYEVVWLEDQNEERKQAQRFLRLILGQYT